MMTSVETMLVSLWCLRPSPGKPYLLINDPRGYLQDVSMQLLIDGVSISVHICQNEWALRSDTEAERDSGSPTPRIIISRQQLEPENLPDLQARSSLLRRSLTACDIAEALGVAKPRPLLDRLPKDAFWALAPYLSHLDKFSLERLILAALLDDPSVLSAGWEPAGVLEKLWFEGSLNKIRSVLGSVDGTERTMLESELLDIVKTWLDTARYAIVHAAILEAEEPPVLPFCLLACILNGWDSLTPATMRAFLDESELGDLFADVLKDGTDLSGLADWGSRIRDRDGDECSAALTYLQQRVFPKKPTALTQALSAVVKGVSGNGTPRLLGQLVRLMEADGGMLAQGLAVTLKSLLGVTEADAIAGLPLENAAVDLTKKLDAAEAAEWESLLDALRAHQAREKYEDHVSLLEALVTVHRLTEKGERASNTLAGLDWKAWLELADKVYLPLAAQTAEAERLAGCLTTAIDISAVTRRSKVALDAIRAAYATFYVDPTKGLPNWIANRRFSVGTCRPAINSDVLEYFVKPLFRDAGLQQVYLIVFDGMSVPNWAMLRDRFIMAHGRELFRFYQGAPEHRAFTFLPSMTHLCRRAIFAGTIPSTFYTWAYAANESELLSSCLRSHGCVPPGFDKSKHYFCFNEKEADPEKLNRDLRTLIEMPAKFKAIVLNLQDRLLDKSGISSIQEIMLAYVREVALPHLRRISAQKNTAVVITSDHGFASYDMQYKTMPNLDTFKTLLTTKLGFALHQINDGESKGIFPEQNGISERAAFLVSTSAGNCYSAFRHPGQTLSDAEANRYKALSILMPNGPAAYCVVQVGDVLRCFLVERGNEIHLPPEQWDSVRDAEDMVRELLASKINVEHLEQWARKTLNTENSLVRFVQILKGCWQDIWDIENQRNDWIFDEFSRFLFIKLNEDAKSNGAFTTARLESFCRENSQMGEKGAQAFINQLFDDLRGHYSEVFTDPNEKVLSRSNTISRVIERLEGINLKDTQGDVLGRAFEVMLSDTFKGADLGQFFTPREVVKFMLDLARPRPDEAVIDVSKGERILDAVAGSGGFLIAVYEDAYRHITSKVSDPALKQLLLKRLGQDTIYACEIEEKAARVGKLNLIVHATDPANARWLHQNYLLNKEHGGLKPEITFRVDFGDGPVERRIGPDTFDLIMTNPPFGKSVKTESILLDYQFGHEIKTFKSAGRSPRKCPRNSQDSEVLFIEHYLRVLKPGGRLLIVLPDGVLSNATAKPVRDYMRQQAIIRAVVSLPSETFASTGTTIPTNVVYLQKKRPGDVQGEIFMARADAVGRRANGDPIPENDLPFILEKFRDWASGRLTSTEVPV
jgi:type I restriction enzyme M protein